MTQVQTSRKDLLGFFSDAMKKVIFEELINIITKKPPAYISIMQNIEVLALYFDNEIPDNAIDSYIKLDPQNMYPSEELASKDLVAFGLLICYGVLLQLLFMDKKGVYLHNNKDDIIIAPETEKKFIQKIEIYFNTPYGNSESVETYLRSIAKSINMERTNAKNFRIAD